MRRKIFKKSLLLGGALIYGITAGNSALANTGHVHVTGKEQEQVENGTMLDTDGGRRYGVYVDLGGTVELGKDVTINHLDGEISSGIYVINDTQNTGASVGQSTLTAGDNLTINSGGHQTSAITVRSSNSTDGSRVEIADNLRITTGIDAGRGQGNHGIHAVNEKSSVKVGDGLYLETNGTTSYGLYAVQGAQIEVGKNAQLISQASAGSAIQSESKAHITVGDNATIVSDTGASGYAVHSWYGGNITLGNSTTITTKNDWGYGIRAQAGQNSQDDTFINIGDKLTLQTLGDRAHGISVSFKNLVATGQQATIITEGDLAYGIDLSGAGAEIQTGNQTKIYTSGNSAHGIFANKGKAFVGDDSVIHTKGDESLGAYIYGENAFANFGKGTSIITEGKETISLYAGKGANISLGQDSSVFAQGDDSSAITSARTDSHITIGNGGTIIASGNNANAVYAFDGGVVDLKGNQYIEADVSKSSYALLAEGTRVSDEKVNLAQINADGKLTLLGGVKADDHGQVNLALQSGSYFEGFTVFSKDGGEINLSMTDSNWSVAPNDNALLDTVGSASEVNKLSLNNSTVDLSKVDGFTSLSVNKLSGDNGQFVMKSDIAGFQSDQLVINQQAEGSHNVNVKDKGSAKTTGEEIVTVLTSHGGSPEFKLTNETVDAGGFAYKLRQSETDAKNWELYSTGEASTGGSASVNTFIGSYLLSDVETNTMLQRMGDIRNGTGSAGVWARAYGGKYEAGSNQLLSGFNMNYSGMQIGVDKTNVLDNGASLTWGGMFGYSSGRLAYPTGKTELDGKTLGLYGTYQEQKGFYADLVMKYMWMNNKFNVLDNTFEEVRGDKIKTGGLGASVEIGKRFSLSDDEKGGWYVEPQAQLSYARQNGGSFAASNGLQVNVAGFDSLQTRLGVVAGYEVKGGKNAQNIYAKVSHVKEHKGDVSASFNGTQVGASYGGSWWTYGVGYAVQLDKKQQLYVDIERSSGGPFKKPWAVNAGFRFNF